MPIRNGSASGGNAWKVGLRLAILNSLLDALYMVVTFGILGKGVFFSMFPIREISLLYLAVLIISWVLFALRLPVSTPTETFKTALLGTLPLLGLSMLFYVLGTQAILQTTVVAYHWVSTLFFLAGIACVALVTLVASCFKRAGAGTGL